MILRPLHRKYFTNNKQQKNEKINFSFISSNDFSKLICL